MLTIRKYVRRDKAILQDICVATSWLKDDDTPLNRAYLCAMYNDYYTDFEPDNIFVSADDNDVPVGYIIASTDYGKYEEKMRDLYLPFIRKLNGKAYFTAAADVKFDRKYVEMGYEAHLHIDILDGYRHEGVGTRLMNELVSLLKEKNVNGLFLNCGSKNEPAKNFYKKFGFQEIDFLPGCVVFGLKLFAEEN